MDADQPWKSLLRPSLQILALSAAEQIHENGPGCPTCDMSEEFFHGRSYAIETGNLAAQQVALLDQINELLQSMQALDDGCSNQDALNEPLWDSVRSVSNDALREFGWSTDDRLRFVETEPGVWRRLS